MKPWASFVKDQLFSFILSQTIEGKVYEIVVSRQGEVSKLFLDSFARNRNFRHYVRQKREKRRS